MKKSLRKLSLSRETLLTLENPDLQNVQGGGNTAKNCPLTGSGCDYTFGCTVTQAC